MMSGERRVVWVQSSQENHEVTPFEVLELLTSFILCFCTIELELECKFCYMITSSVYTESTIQGVYETFTSN